jgi:hypothetical protein
VNPIARIEHLDIGDREIGDRIFVEVLEQLVLLEILLVLGGFSGHDAPIIHGSRAERTRLLIRGVMPSLSFF